MKLSALGLFGSLFLLLSPAVAGEAELISKVQEAEKQINARIGLAIRNTGTGETWRYRADERFPMASTFKLLACAALLAHIDEGKEDGNRRVTINQNDIVTYSPLTENWVGQAVSLETLCDATMRTSDNTAANKVLEAIGGPQGLTAFLRAQGDIVTRLDRWETELNEAIPGDPRDTTTPDAIVNLSHKLLLEDGLSAHSRKTLTNWMMSNEVGGPLMRAGLPETWRIGDRTGAGGYGTRGIVAIIWPPEQKPLIAAIYITQTDASIEQRNAAIASIARQLAETLSDQPR
ncbi:class A beta-lactamase [Falsochrobactrum ovis]|uniref:Beta-lactamase n=1 Tax=Falsochrobactrum ovis TaxID=1293442 RepID=A0A364JT59_9HYPH|nr:class A beta-lactamase [Falsochrobactrum ovis]RAK26817.1 beta-lactamase class A CARB-5 [Falsochrobactrum ovis]